MLSKGGFLSRSMAASLVRVSFFSLPSFHVPVLSLHSYLLRRSPTNLESAMNIELEEVVVLDVSDGALELAAGVEQAGPTGRTPFPWVIASARPVSHNQGDCYEY